MICNVCSLRQWKQLFEEFFQELVYSRFHPCMNEAASIEGTSGIVVLGGRASMEDARKMRSSRCLSICLNNAPWRTGRAGTHGETDLILLRKSMSMWNLAVVGEEKPSHLQPVTSSKPKIRSNVLLYRRGAELSVVRRLSSTRLLALR